MNLEFIPLTRRFHVCILWCSKAVNRPGLMNRQARWITLPDFVNLHLEAEINCNVRRVVVALAIGIWKTQKHARVVVVAPTQKLEFQNKICGRWINVPEHSQVVAGQRLKRAVHDQEGPGIVSAWLICNLGHPPTA